MEAFARAGIDIYNRSLRYAEVEQYGARYRLLRLGSCDFDFSVTGEIWDAETAEHLSTVTEALSDVFSGSIASDVFVTLHPPGCYSFFTPIPVDTPDDERKTRLQQEATLLAGVDTPLRLTADAVYTETLDDGKEVDWVHVLAVDERVHRRYSDILSGMPQSRRRLVVSMHGAAKAIVRVAASEEENAGAPYALGIGWYPSHLEFVVCRGERWHFSHFAATGTPTDAAYFSAALLQRLGHRTADVGRLFIYGDSVDIRQFGLLERVYSASPERLNPLTVVDLDQGSLSDDFDAEAYVPCMGSAL